MVIKELNLKNFGKFSGERFSFGDGINVIYGLNEAGKTTLYHGIGAMLFGLEKQRGRAARTDTYTTYQPWENKTWYEGSMKFVSGKKVFCLERNFYHNEKSARLVCETDGEELSIADGDLEMLLGDVSGELYFNTAAAGQLKMKPQDIVYSYLKNYIASVQESGSHSMDVVKALSILEGKKKALEQQKKKQAQEVREQITKVDARLGLLEQEITGYLSQLEQLNKKKAELLEVSEKQQGFWKRFFCWLKQIFFGRHMQKEAQQRREEILKIQEKLNFLKEILGEKESFQEELLLEKDSFYEKLHIQSKDKEIQALDLAMERIRTLSALRKEEVMERLLVKASEVLKEMTKGKYQKLILEEGEEPCVWDGRKKVMLFQVSTGCVDQIYLSLRIALQDLLFEEETLPLMFDDGFVYFDDARLERLLEYLSMQKRQVLLFTCHKREFQLLEKLQIPYKKIVL